MWFYAPQRWYEVPGWLWRAWSGARAEERRKRASATEAPSRPATRPRQARVRLHSMSEHLEIIRKAAAKARPEKCCKGGVMTLSDKSRHEVCSDDCAWQALDLAIANAMVDAD